MPTYPLYTAVLAKLGARARVLPHRPGARLAARPRSPAQPRHAGHARARRHRSEQPDRAPSTRRRSRRALLDVRRAARPRRSWPTRSTATSATTARSRRSAASIPTRRSSRSRACRRRISRPAGAPAGWRSAARRGSTTSLAAIKKLADGRLCSTVPMQYAVDRGADGRPLAPGRRSARR